MKEKMIMRIAVGVLGVGMAASYSGGIYFYTQYNKKMQAVDTQRWNVEKKVNGLRGDLKDISSSLSEINTNIVDYVRSVSLLEAKITVSSEERNDLLTKLSSIETEIQSLRKTYVDYVDKLDEMGEILSGGKTLVQEDTFMETDDAFVKATEMTEASIGERAQGQEDTLTQTGDDGGEFVREMELGEIAVEKK